MSDYKDSFIETYNDDAVSMIDLAEELVLVHTPNVSLTGNPYTEKFDSRIDGYAMEDIEGASGDFKDARKKEAAALMKLIGFGTRVSMDLAANELGTATPGDTDPYTAEQEALVEGIFSQAGAEVESGTYTYSSFEFVNESTDETVAITLCEMKSTTSAVHARQLDISVSDQHLAKTLRISESPASSQGNTTVDIKQSIEPTNDELMGRVSNFFQEKDSLEDRTVVHSIFLAELTGSNSASQDLDRILNKYKDSEDFNRLVELLEEVKQRAQAIKLSRSFIMTNPEIDLPSAPELQEYKDLLSQIRA